MDGNVHFKTEARSTKPCVMIHIYLIRHLNDKKTTKPSKVFPLAFANSISSFPAASSHLWRRHVNNITSRSDCFFTTSWSIIPRIDVRGFGSIGLCRVFDKCLRKSGTGMMTVQNNPRTCVTGGSCLFATCGNISLSLRLDQWSRRITLHCIRPCLAQTEAECADICAKLIFPCLL